MIRVVHTPQGSQEIDSATVSDQELAALGLTREKIFPLEAVRHWAVVNAFSPSAEKPLQVKRNYCGAEYTVNCYVSQDLVDLYPANLQVGDLVIVDFIDGEMDKPFASQKVYKSW